MNTKLRGRHAAAWLAALLLIAAVVPPASAQMVTNQLRSYADVAEVASPAVVNIAAAKVVDNAATHPFMNDPFFRRFFEMPDDENHRRNERVDRSLGSGVVISADGYILTNNHVVENAEKVLVTFEADREFEAEIVGTDPRTDVALLKIDADDLPYIRIADSDGLRVGDQVMAIGNPFGVGQTVTLGIASALGRSIGLIDYEDLIQTDASINPGNSGGALVNMDGELVGMNSAILSRSGGSQGIGFAIPSNMAMRVVDALRTHGVVERAYLGVLPQQVSQSIADYHGLERPRGVLIAQVNDDTPADKAGLKDGDIILTVDGQDIDSPSKLRNVISLSDVGHTADLEILRDGKQKRVAVELDVLPDPDQPQNDRTPQSEDEDASLDGVTVVALTPGLRERAQLPDGIDGLLVRSVEPTSNAAEAGLRSGDVIQEVAREEVLTLSDFQSALKINKDRPVFMRVYQANQRQSVFVAVPR